MQLRDEIIKTRKCMPKESSVTLYILKNKVFERVNTLYYELSEGSTSLSIINLRNTKKTIQDKVWNEVMELPIWEDMGYEYSEKLRKKIILNAVDRSLGVICFLNGYTESCMKEIKKNILKAIKAIEETNWAFYQYSDDFDDICNPRCRNIKFYRERLDILEDAIHIMKECTDFKGYQLNSIF